MPVAVLTDDVVVEAVLALLLLDAGGGIGGNGGSGGGTTTSPHAPAERMLAKASHLPAPLRGWVRGPTDVLLVS